jgi:hypothetical protein
MDTPIVVTALAVVSVLLAPSAGRGLLGDDTRALLEKVADSSDTRALARLIRDADSRADHLVRALDDPDTDVCVAAQRVIEYSQSAALLARLTAWREQRAHATGRVVTPGINRLKSPVYLDCSKRALPKEVLRRLHAAPGTSARIIAENHSTGSIVLRVVYGDVAGNAFTSGYDVVVKRRGRGWDVIVNTLRWES